MRPRPFFSIAIPTYNRSEKLKTAIKYLLDQDFKDFEIVVSDNFSTDNTSNVVSSFKSSKIKYYRNKKNIDVLPNVKRSIGLSKGKYVFLHGDDDFLIEENTLSEVYRVIKKHKFGYVRLNYLSISPDRKHIFDFRASKYFSKDAELQPNSRPSERIEFLINSDCSFITGIIFKNEIPKNISVIDSQLYSWFPMIYYVSEHFGAYYMNKVYILAGWSQWRVSKENFHSLFSLRGGKLTSEKYFEFVKSKIGGKKYNIFLAKYLVGIYVKNFIIVKLYTGNKNMLKLAARLRYLLPDLKYKMIFWFNLFLAYFFPRIALSLLRKWYLILYINHSSMDSKYNVGDIFSKR